ncbi:MAG: YggS family pyridoxal phosphate-dependent enzyme, partial [Actinomycetota bacterium]|nr:YggS family pyridoxal phosphate-dependent enzyme [Actinomycetota bacterium]
VSKTFGLDAVNAAIEAGINDLGENRAQEFKQKVAVAGNRARWHFIGHLQTNKVRNVVGTTFLIHSVDRFGLAEAIARRAATLGVTQDVLIEVNVARDPRKFGIAPAGLRSLLGDIAELESIRVRGLMTMAPFADDPAESRPYFAELAELGAELGGASEPVELSMGMTRDFEVAIEEGATIVRVGEAIFGPRRPAI